MDFFSKTYKFFKLTFFFDTLKNSGGSSAAAGTAAGSLGDTIAPDD
jgi:hypothetical protein